MRCCRCKQDKPDQDFNWKSRTSNRRDPVCKQCRVQVRRQWYLNHRPEIIRRNTISNRHYRAKTQKYVKDYLSSHPCVDCGESDLVVLEFDHVRGTKVMDVSRMVSHVWGIKSIALEIEKCDVRCANCHRRVTFRRRSHSSNRRASPS